MKFTLSEIRALRNIAKLKVALQLPEDEHDYTADWVYETAIKVALDHAQQQSVRETVALVVERSPLSNRKRLKKRTRKSQT